MNKILVCYDFSKNSEKALEVAAAWAMKFESSIDLVYVDDNLVHAGLYADIAVPHFEENAYKFREELFQGKMNKIKEKYSHSHITIHSHLLYGNPRNEILKFVEENSTSLLVLGSRGVNLFSSFRIGSFALGLATTTQIPLLCVKHDMEIAPARVLYASELNKSEEKSLEVLKTITDVYRPHLEIGHIISPDTQLVAGYEAKAEKVYNQLELKMDLAHQRALYRINDLVEKWKFEDTSTFVDDAVDENPAKRLLAHVEQRDIDLLVLGSHGKNFWDRVVLGSISEYILKRCSKSFLIIPNKEK